MDLSSHSPLVDVWGGASTSNEANSVLFGFHNLGIAIIAIGFFADDVLN
jgi:hypothetical protein